MKTISVLLVGCIIFFTSACDSSDATTEIDPETVLEPNTFAAQLRGAITADIKGSVSLGFQDEFDGYFIQLDSSGIVDEGGVYTLISLRADDGSAQLRLVQFGNGLEEVTYPVDGPVNFDEGIEPPFPFQILYSTASAFSRATSGSVTLTTVTDDEVTGKFDYIGELSGEELRIQGSFKASRENTSSGPHSESFDEITLENRTGEVLYYHALELELSHRVDPRPSYPQNEASFSRIGPGEAQKIQSIDGYEKGDDVRFFLYAPDTSTGSESLIVLKDYLTVQHRDLIKNDGRVVIMTL